MDSPKGSAVVAPERPADAGTTTERRTDVDTAAQDMLDSIRQRRRDVRTASDQGSDDEDDDDEDEEDDDEEGRRSRRKKRRRRNGARDSVRSYLQEIGSHKLLKAEKEIELARRIQTLLRFERAFEAFIVEVGRKPNEPEWATQCGHSFEEFKVLLHQGRTAKEKMVRSNPKTLLVVGSTRFRLGLPCCL